MMQRETKQIRLGFLYPGYAAEDDYPLLAMNAGQEIIVHVVHTSQDEDAHRVDALLDLGSLSRLLEGAKVLRDQAVDAVGMYQRQFRLWVGRCPSAGRGHCAGNWGARLEYAVCLCRCQQGVRSQQGRRFGDLSGRRLELFPSFSGGRGNRGRPHGLSRHPDCRRSGNAWTRAS